MIIVIGLAAKGGSRMGQIRMGRGLRGMGVLLVVAAAALVGCGGSNSGGSGSPTPSTEPSTSASPNPEPGQVIQTYFEAMVHQDGAVMAAQAAPDSPASKFATYWADLIEASIVAERTVTTTDTQATVTRVDDNTQVIYADFSFEPSSGLLVTWTEQPGGPLQARINTQQKSATIRPFEVVVQDQFVTSKGELLITLEVKNPSRQKVDMVAQDWVSPERVQRSATIGSGNSMGVLTMQPRSTAYAVISVEKAGTTGGRVGLQTYPSPGGQTLGETTLKLP